MSPLSWTEEPGGQHLAERGPWAAKITTDADEHGPLCRWRVYGPEGCKAYGWERTLEASKAAAAGAIEMRETMASHPERVDVVTTSGGRLRGDGTGAEIRVEPIDPALSRLRAKVQAFFAYVAEEGGILGDEPSWLALQAEMASTEPSAAQQATAPIAFERTIKPEHMPPHPLEDGAILRTIEVDSILNADASITPIPAKEETMKVKYVEERFPRWFVFGTRENSRVDVADANGDVFRDIAPDVAERLIAVRHAYVDGLIAAIGEDYAALTAYVEPRENARLNEPEPVEPYLRPLLEIIARLRQSGEPIVSEHDLDLADALEAIEARLLRLEGASP